MDRHKGKRIMWPQRNLSSSIKFTQKKKLVYNSQVFECYEIQRKHKYFPYLPNLKKKFDFKVKILKVYY